MGKQAETRNHKSNRTVCVVGGSAGSRESVKEGPHNSGLLCVCDK